MYHVESQAKISSILNELRKTTVSKVGWRWPVAAGDKKRRWAIGDEPSKSKEVNWSTNLLENADTALDYVSPSVKVPPACASTAITCSIFK
jgi:hypothetical protein